MSLKINDKEITALAKKIEQKQKDAKAVSFKAKAKKFYPQAATILKQLDGMPPVILDWLYSNRYNRSTTTKENLAMKLLTQDNDYEPEALQSRDIIESDIVLKANGCKTLGELCNKLGV